MPIMPYPAFYVGRFASVAAEIEAKDTEPQPVAKKADSNALNSQAPKTEPAQTVAKPQMPETSNSNTQSRSETPAINSDGRLNLLA